jgi:hypothetical protein
MKILEYLMDEEHNEKQAYLLKREEKVDVTLPEKFSSRLNILALILARKVDERASHPKTVFNGESELCGIRAKENLMTFLKSIALYRGRDVVTESDFDELRRLYRFMNFNFRNIDACREEPMKENHSMLKLETIRKRPREGVT